VTYFFLQKKYAKKFGAVRIRPKNQKEKQKEGGDAHPDPPGRQVGPFA